MWLNDRDEFRELYLKMRYKDEVKRVIGEEGKIIWGLEMIGYGMSFCDEVICSWYIWGGCRDGD